ncbi:MAG: hypothetical protein AB7O73_10715, partial [Bacteroidia bacterium]
MRSTHLFIFFLLTSILKLNSQEEWSLKVSSTVELRTIQLTTEIITKDEPIGGAKIKLLKGNSVIKEIQSEGNGDFVMDVPANGDFIMEVSYPKCNAKRFHINTTGVPADKANSKFKPSIRIEGVIMAPPIYSINYSALSQPMTFIKYNESKKKFLDDESYTNQSLQTLSAIRNSEIDLLEQYITAVKNGDAALAKNDCPTAKANFEKAISLLPPEYYPKQRIKLTDKCIEAKAAEEAKKKADEEAAAKAKAEAEAKAKAEEEAAAKAKAEAEAKAKAEAEAKKKAEEEAAAKAKAEAEAKAKAEAEAKKKAEEEAAAKAKAEAEAKAKAEAEAKKKAGEEAAAKAKAEAEAKAKAEAEAKKKAEEEAAAKAKAEAEAKAKAEAEA